MKARIPKDYKEQIKLQQKLQKEQEQKDFSLKLLQHFCKGLMVVMYKKFEWRKKRCTELLTDVIDYLNKEYDEEEVEEILQKLDLTILSDKTENK